MVRKARGYMGLKGGARHLAAATIFSLITFASPPGAGRLATSGSRPSSTGYVQTTRDEEAPSPASLAREIQTALTQGQVDRARDSLRKLLNHPRLDPYILRRVGVALAQAELYPEASQVFSRCVRDHPEIFEAHYNLALAEFAQQKLPEASAALEESPHGPKAQEMARLYLRGKIEDALGKTSEAERDLTAAFSGAPQQENYGLDLGLFYIRERNYPRATQIFERSVSGNPQRKKPRTFVSL